MGRGNEPDGADERRTGSTGRTRFAGAGRTELRAAMLAGLMVLSVVAPFVAFTGTTAAAETTATVDIENPASGETTEHNWTVVVNSGTSGTLDEIRLNYTGTGADASNASATEVSINGSSVDVTEGASGNYLNLTLSNSRSIDGSEKVVVEASGVVNPASAGTPNASIELVSGSTAFDSYNGSLGIVQGGFINGTVTNGSGNAVSGASIVVTNATRDEFVAAYGTAPDGTYSANVPAGSYTVAYTKNGYERITKTVDVDTGAENTTNAVIEKVGYVNGTLTDSDGAVGRATTILVNTSGGTFTDVDSNVSDPNGNYSLKATNGTYDVVVLSTDHELRIVRDVGITAESTTAQDITLTQIPDKGTITGSVVDSDGNPVTSGTVSVRDDSYEYFNSTSLSGSNTFSLKVPAGTYGLTANADGFPSERVQDIEVTEGGTTDVTVTLSEPAYLNGTVKNASGGVGGALVLAESGGQTAVNITDPSGKYNLTVPGGEEYTVSVFANGQDAPSKSVNATSGNTTETNFTLEATEILAKNVTKLSGPGDGSKIGVRTEVRNGLLQIQLVNESARPPGGVGAPSELETLGVNESTQFEINVTVTNFSANSLLWGLRDAELETTNNTSVTSGTATDVTIRGSPVTLQATFSGGQSVGPLLRQDPSDVNWPTGRGDRADDGYNDTVYIGVFDLSSVPESVRDTLDGVSVTTNAQRFSTPTVENESLRVWVAAPSKTVDGNNHTGFYQATIPDSQLDEWGVDDPETELRALYKGEQRDFTVTETTNGARIVLDNITYSAGFTEVETTGTADEDDDGGGTAITGTIGRAELVDGGARVTFGSGSDVSSVEVISPGANGALNVRRLGRVPDDVPSPGGIVVTSLDITAPTPSSGSATVRIVLSDSLLDRHTVPPERMVIRRYDADSGEWETLDTSSSDVEAGALLKARTDEFSVFAVSRRETGTATPTPTPTATPTPTPTPTATASAGTSTATAADTTTTGATPTDTTAGAGETTSGGATTESDGPGLGPVVAVVALVTAAALVLRRD